MKVELIDHGKKVKDEEEFDSLSLDSDKDMTIIDESMELSVLMDRQQ